MALRTGRLGMGIGPLFDRCCGLGAGRRGSMVFQSSSLMRCLVCLRAFSARASFGDFLYLGCEYASSSFMPLDLMFHLGVTFLRVAPGMILMKGSFLRLSHSIGIESRRSFRDRIHWMAYLHAMDASVLVLLAT